MQKAIFLSLFLPTMAAVAAERSITCGDHWLTVEANWADGQTVGKAFFSGDSRPNRSNIKASITEEDKLIRVKFDDKLGGELIVDAEENGTLIGATDGSKSIIASCTVK